MNETGENTGEKTSEKAVSGDQMAGLVTPGRAQPGTVVLMVSPCRSGSTAMLRVFGYSGCLAVFQPIKNALRWRQLGQEKPWQLPQVRQLFLKETFGPHHGFEVSFDPLTALLHAGVAAQKLRMVVLLRDPVAVWSSWQSVWPGRTSLQTLRGAYAACDRMLSQAQALGVPSRMLAYEDCTRDPQAAFRGLFDWIGLGLPPDALGGWQGKPGFAQPGSGVVMPDEPEQYLAPAAHAPIIESTSFCAQTNRTLTSKALRRDVQHSDLPALHADLTKKARLMTA